MRWTVERVTTGTRKLNNVLRIVGCRCYVGVWCYAWCTPTVSRSADTSPKGGFGDSGLPLLRWCVMYKAPLWGAGGGAD